MSLYSSSFADTMLGLQVFFKLSPMKLLWPALQLKATGQKSLIFVVGLSVVRLSVPRDRLAFI